MKIADLKGKLLVTLIVFTCILLLYVFDVPCVFRSLTGVKCLGCGMTRAFLALLRLDFEEAFMHHKMVWSLPLLYWCFLKDGKPFKKRLLNLAVYFVLIMGFVINVAFC